MYLREQKVASFLYPDICLKCGKDEVTVTVTLKKIILRQYLVFVRSKAQLKAY